MAIRGRLRKLGPVFKGYDTVGGDRRRFDDTATYAISVLGKTLLWANVHGAILDIYSDKKNRWCLQEFLWSKEPTRAQYVVARPYLMKMWNHLKEVA